MYLKCIKINGFKSFADKIDLEFKNDITAIVGPNGSGKSNIVDAVRWVLGEQSVKALRGSTSMSDVIFAGSATRPGATRASVALIFDNTDHYLKSEFNEVEVKRVVYKTGENDYFINNEKVRLKDIINLFMDTGAGKEAFNIISQGAVTNIILSKPEDRRSIIEEAAGVLKYKTRKEETLKKLAKTNENITRIDLLTKELETTLNPLKEQKDLALKYEEYKKDLESMEISLIANDITSYSSEYKDLETKLKTLNDNTLDYDTTTKKDQAQLEKLKLENIVLDEKIEKENSSLIEIEKKITELAKERQVIIERQKFNIDNTKLDTLILELKEKIAKLTKSKNVLENDLTNCNNVIKDYTTTIDSLTNNSTTIENKLTKITTKINDIEKRNIYLDNQITIKTELLESNALLPNAVKYILENKRLNGIYTNVGNAIKPQDKMDLAIDVALGSSKNIIITEDSASAKEAINYLKQNKLGRVTFFPLDVIKPRFLDKEILDIASSTKNFLGVASTLVNYDPQYQNIALNLLGNILVVKDIDTLNTLGKKIKYRAKIVSLTGEVLASGGAITGGIINSGTFKEKSLLDTLKAELTSNQDILTTQNKEKNFLTKELTNLTSTILETKNNLGLELDKQTRYQTALNELNLELKEASSELNREENMKGNTLDKELEKIIDDYYKALETKEINLKELNKLKDHKSEISTTIQEIEQNISKIKENYNKMLNESKDIEVRLGKLDVLLDNLILTLNEDYSITYEKAAADYPLVLEAEVVRTNVSHLKNKIKDLGEINLGSIKEYDRLNERYTYLNNQKEELNTSVNSLLEIIQEMDEIMKTRFKETFDKVNLEFATVFKKLFKGGDAHLALTEDDLLTTGIEIMASPPGKKIKNIASLSGGEMTLTSISLLFAILNVKPVPFCILDEIEAALDDVNVVEFGKYLVSKKDNSQFIVITHKKKTMEYADTLYGITMQESGVSKLVSVKLES